MPDNTRGLLIKKCDQTLGHLEQVENNLMYMNEKYYPDYPDYYEPLLMALETTETMIKLLREFREGM